MTMGLQNPDSFTRVTPMGVRFWDAAQQVIVSDGLAVTAYSPAQPSRRFSAGRNSSGVFIFSALPGLAKSLAGAGDDAFWAAPPISRTFTIEVVDQSGQFTAFTFNVVLPYRGLVKVAGVPGPNDAAVVSPPGDVLSSVPLFSAPARRIPPGCGVVRAELVDIDTGLPAAWAVVGVRIGNDETIWGIADEQGRVAIFFNYPEPNQFSATTSGAPRLPLNQQTWPVVMNVLYSPAVAPRPSSTLRIPDLATLFDQKPAGVWGALSPNTALGPGTVTFGQDTFISSAGGNSLLVSAAP
ncbi:MAG TPA: hypothetical protein VG326_21300 [Tepidisphaeraceae bacterium]|jgi:hypothetical protein|nr:hypothetical protein [Tepidisphaeraceae bacterium]